MASACAIKFSYFHVLSREAFMNHIQLYPDLLVPSYLLSKSIIRKETKC